MNKLAALAGTALSLVGGYLILTNAGGATSILKALSGGTVNIFRTLQGR